MSQIYYTTCVKQLKLNLSDKEDKTVLIYSQIK